MLRLILLVLLFSSLPLETHAASYCHEEDLVLDLETTLNFRAGFATEIPLLTHRNGSLVPSMGKLQLGANGEPVLWAIFENSGKGSLGIEYMVYKIEIRIGEPADSQVFAEDFSHD